MTNWQEPCQVISLSHVTPWPSLDKRIVKSHKHEMLNTVASLFRINTKPSPYCYFLFAGYSPLAPPSQSPPVPSLLHQGPKVMSSSSPASAPALPSLSSLSSLNSMASVPGVMAAAGPSQAPPNKKYRPPHKTDKFTPKPIPPELGNLKTYSEWNNWWSVS